MLPFTFPSREAVRRLPFGLADVVVVLGSLTLVALLARAGAGAIVRFASPGFVPALSLDAANRSRAHISHGNRRPD